ncbi:hypothetical protein EVAR_22827_1 [Eumeta japonica]|uniref:Uncharacterized protein n=1 Tax=Eumeta variegata TaxID=151549 RepID=A0A4C1VHY7_EUMVA|nr:hypothetical protein EVAR_22827_1 [Eumeta japonica]
MADQKTANKRLGSCASLFPSREPGPAQYKTSMYKTAVTAFPSGYRSTFTSRSECRSICDLYERRRRRRIYARRGERKRLIEYATVMCRQTDERELITLYWRSQETAL